MATMEIYFVACYSGVMVGETGENWSYKPWGGDYMSYSGETLRRCVVEIPAGFVAGETVLCEKGIFTAGKGGEYCEIGGTKEKPVLYHGGKAIALKIVSEQ